MKRGAMTALCLVLSLAGGVVAGERFKVGDEEGWREPDPAHADMYALWAGRTTFRAGDSLYFEYSSEDSVLLVDKRGYYHCNTTNATAAFHDGKTLFPLPAAALLYFISGAAGHCPHGQRLIVDVLPAPPPPQEPPSLPPAVPPPPSLSPVVTPPATAPTALEAPPPSIPPVAAPLPSAADPRPAAVGLASLVMVAVASL